MKALSFQKPCEYVVKPDGESWPQGGRIEGTLEVKSHDAPPSGRVQLHLAHGEFKKVHAKAEGAFTIISSAANENWFFPASGGMHSYDWAFDLDPNAPISDTQKSLFLVFGHADEGATPPGFLQLNVVPEPAIEELLKTITVAFRFVVKSQKWLKGAVETKFVPPDSKAFSTLDYVTVAAWFEADVLHVEYRFTLKKLEAAAANVEIKKEKRATSQTLAAHEYRLPSGRLNFETYEQKIQEALSTVEVP